MRLDRLIVLLALMLLGAAMACTPRGRGGGGGGGGDDDDSAAADDDATDDDDAAFVPADGSFSGPVTGRIESGRKAYPCAGRGSATVEGGVGRGSLRCYDEILEVECLAEFESVEQRMGGTGTVTFNCAADAGATTVDFRVVGDEMQVSATFTAGMYIEMVGSMTRD